MDDDKLYIFLHVPKTAGMTFIRHVENNLRPDEFLHLAMNLPEHDKDRVTRFMAALAENQKERIRMIFGHPVYYGIHEFFDKEPIYFTFLREPVSRALSLYNFGLTRLEECNKRPFGRNKKIREFFEQNYTENGRILPFGAWLEKQQGIVDEAKWLHMSTFLYKRGFLDGKRPDDKAIDKCLDKFFFVGITETYDEDALFLYNLLDFRRFYRNWNISKKYFIPENYNDVREAILSKNPCDEILYEKALIRNKEFKESNEDFHDIVRSVKSKRTLRMPVDETRKILLDNAYKTSWRLRTNSRVYADFIENITSPLCAGKPDLYIQTVSQEGASNGNPQVMTDEVFEGVLKKAASERFCKISIYYRNEPLKDPKFIDRLGRIRDLRNYRLIEIATNAALLSPDYAKLLLYALRGVKTRLFIVPNGTEALENVSGLLFESDGGLDIRIIGYSGSRDEKEEKEYMDFWNGFLKELELENTPKVAYVKGETIPVSHGGKGALCFLYTGESFQCKKYKNPPVD